MGSLKKNKGLYWALIGTFIFLWCAVAFVSTLHAIAFFQITNALALAILLGTAYEIGQASVLFSILMTENKNKLLAWSMLLLLTALQVTANVYASFRYMELSESIDWTFWQRAVLLGVEFEDPEMYKIVIAWISGALLPIVALGLTALVADNIAMVREEKRKDLEIEEKIKTNVEEDKSESKPLIVKENTEEIIKDDDKEFEILGDLITNESGDSVKEEVEKTNTKNIGKKQEEPIEPIEPVNKPRGWHFKKEFIDDAGNVFQKGKYSHTVPIDQIKEENPSKKV